MATPGKKPVSAPVSPAASSRWTPLLLHAGILAAFYILLMAYFSPVIFGGKQVSQSDIIQYQGMQQEMAEFRKETGQEALWVSTLFGGMPGYQSGVFYLGNTVNVFNRLLWMGLSRPAGYIWVTFLGFFFLLRVLKASPAVSGIGAAAYALSSYFFIILEAGHTSKANAISFMAPLIASILLTYRGKWILGGALTALFTLLQVNANHLQITYYLVMAIGILGISLLIDAIRQKTLPDFLKASAILLGAALLGVAPNISRLWTTAEYAAETLRGPSELAVKAGDNASGLDQEYALRWSYGISESLTLLVPDAFGGASGVEVSRTSNTAQELRRQFGNSEQIGQVLQNFPAYWGDQPFTSGPVYAGAIVCMLFVLGLLVRGEPLKPWLIAVSVLFLALSWGRNFLPLTDLFFSYFPGYDKFRAPAMMLVMVEFAMPLLGALALQRILSPEAQQDPGLTRKVLIAAGIAGGLSLLVALMAWAGIFSFSADQDERYGQLADILVEYRKETMAADALRSLLFIGLAAGVMLLYLRNVLKAVPASLLLGALVLADMAPVNYRYLNANDYVPARRYEQQFQPSAADKLILQDQDPGYRVLNLSVATFDDALTSYHHRSIGGYHAAKLRRYQDVIDSLIRPEILRIDAAFKNQPTDSSIQATFAGLTALKMLNMRYLIYNPERPPLQNASALGDAWFVESIRKVNSPNEEIDALRQIDPRREAVVDVSRFPDPGTVPVPDSAARIVLTSFKPNELVYEASSAAGGAAVFSEVYYNQGKGWKAYVDGQPAEHFRVNYILRGMVLPAGTHQVTFRFEPASFYQGETLSWAFLALLVLAVAGAAWYETRKIQRGN
ncbi:MAG: hypothetical protein NW241_03770 [Bacteroidia bacterium]|nr:hypothetical protein [Bacteroidia bacterium]